MADNEQQLQEKTEQATPKRLAEARKKGQIARSKELNMAFIMIAGSAVLFAGGPQLGQFFVDLLKSRLSFDATWLSSPGMMMTGLSEAGLSALVAFAPFLLLAYLAAILGGVAIGGWSFSPSPMAPKFSKLDPIKGLKRVFGVRGLVETVKAIAKAFVVSSCAIAFLSYASESILKLSVTPYHAAVGAVGSLVTTILLFCSGSLVLIALIDVPFQLWNHAKQLRMTRKEVQDEMKETEGRPEVRGRIRALQQEAANRRMLQDVPAADVIVTNPTHFAVALKYEDGNMRAPIVLAKGQDFMAQRIREIAEENSITFFAAPPLARALYWTTEIGAEIPAQLYLAVAQVLTYVFRLQGAMQGDGEWPDRPRVEVVAELTERPKPGSRNRSRTH
jgi:flagellar biosynthetic protein FlhB